MVTKRCSRPLSGSRTVTARAGGGAWVVFLLAGRGPLFFGGSGPLMVVFAVAMAQV